MKAFIAIVESGSVRAAARQLGLSQPALSKSLRQLENEYAVPLVQRSVRGVVPTEYGQALAARYLVIDEELRRSKEEIAQMRGEKDGHVAIGLSAAAAFLMVADALRRFWSRYPAAKVNIVEGVFDLVAVGLRKGRLDFSIGPLLHTPLGSDVESDPLFKNIIVPVVRQGHPFAAARSLKTLKQCTWAAIGIDPISVELIRASFDDHRLPPPEITLVSQSLIALLEIVVSTDMVTALPRRLLQHRMFRGQVQEVNVREHLRSTTMTLVRRAGVPLTPLAEALAQEFRRYAREQR